MLGVEPGLCACQTSAVPTVLQPQPRQPLYKILYYYVGVWGTCMPQCVCAGQRTPLWGWFSPSAVGFLTIELSVSGLRGKDFYKAPNYLAGPAPQLFLPYLK